MVGKVGQWASRLTGFSVPIFGISWQPPTSERSVAQKLVIYLQDRRVLYNPSDAEVAHHCVMSIIEVRQHLTNFMMDADEGGVLHSHLSSIRAACRQFVDRVRTEADDDFDAMRSPGHYKSWIFLDALGQMRGVIGVHLAALAAAYDLKLGSDLERILPSIPRNEDING